jgi:hypothetical protein
MTPVKPFSGHWRDRIKYREVLVQIKSTGRLDKAALAREFETSTAMIDAILQELVRLDYLRLDALPGCPSDCGSCSSGCAMATGGLPEAFWTITPRGEALITGKR